MIQHGNDSYYTQRSSITVVSTRTILPIYAQTLPVLIIGYALLAAVTI